MWKPERGAQHGVSTQCVGTPMPGGGFSQGALMVSELGSLAHRG